MSLPQFILPSLLIPEVYGPWKAQKGFVPTQMEAAAREGFFRSFEVGSAHDEQDRAAIKRIVLDHGIYLSCWQTDLLDAEQLDLTAIDDTLRQRSVEVVKKNLPIVAETGARTVSFIGGPDPGAALRERGYEALYRSMSALCAEAADFGMSVMFEPLDRFAHKKRLVGPTVEILPVFARIKAEHPNFGMAFDTAHAALNEEDIKASLRLAKDQIVNVHLSNAVLDSRSPLYGDHHMPPGAPGFLTVERAAAIIAEIAQHAIGREQGLPIAIESRARPGEAEQAMANLTTVFLKDALAEASRLCAARAG